MARLDDLRNGRRDKKSQQIRLGMYAELQELYEDEEFTIKEMLRLDWMYNKKQLLLHQGILRFLSARRMQLERLMKQRGATK